MGATRLASGLFSTASPFGVAGVQRCEGAEVMWRFEAAEKTDAGRVAPISGSVFYQIDRLKSGFEVMGRTVMPRNCALMGATRLASGHLSAASPQSVRCVCPSSCNIFCLVTSA